MFNDPYWYEGLLTLIVPVLIIGGPIALYLVGKNSQRKHGTPQEIPVTTIEFWGNGFNRVMRISSTDMITYQNRMAQDGFSCIYVNSEQTQYKVGIIKALYQHLDCEPHYIDDLDPAKIKEVLNNIKDVTKSQIVVIDTVVPSVPDIPNLDNLLADAVKSVSDNPNIKVLIAGSNATHKAITSSGSPLAAVITDTFDVRAVDKMCFSQNRAAVASPYAH